MADNTQYYVVLDANILIRDFWMTSQSFSYLLTHQFLGHRPVIPKVAYLEARSHLKERAETLLANRSPDGTGSHANTQKLLRLFNYKRMSRRLNWDVEKLLTRWDRHIASNIRRTGGMILPHPQVQTVELIQRSIERRKPFSSGSDRGFQDTIIWLSTLALAGPDSYLSFITSNTQDFFEPGSAEPHPEILAEVNEKLDTQRRIRFYRSLDQFIAEFDSDRSASAEALQRALISNTLSGFSLWEWLEENLVESAGEYELDETSWAGFSNYAEGPILTEVEELVAIDIPRISHLVDDTYRMYCDPRLFTTSPALPRHGIWKCVGGLRGA